MHETHGIGIYQGTKRLTSEGASRDYLLVQYLGSDKLYIPVDHLDRIQKYIGGGESAAPKLSRLGGKDWDKQKAKVRESLKELAFDLVKLYAERQKNKGYAFGPDTPWQQEFEENFPYDETPDQLQATEEIKRDMELDRPMDRLLCGDVGYGKTEVALRAAFKAVMDGKQVAILAPTTILAQQHYNTLMRRMEASPSTRTCSAASARPRNRRRRCAGSGWKSTSSSARTGCWPKMCSSKPGPAHRR
ncbi:MAG: CarD family transcriptional regulator [Christensenellales bacterium]